MATAEIQGQDGQTNEVQIHRKGTLTIGVAKDDGKATVSLAGELDLDAAEFADALLQLVEREAWSIEIDLTDLSFIDSTGLWVMVQAKVRAQRNSHRLQIQGVSGQVERTFQLTGLDEPVFA